MKTTGKFLGLIMFSIGLLVVCCTQKQPSTRQTIKNPEVTAQLKSFVAEKAAQARAGTNDVSVFQAFFAAAEKGDWPAVRNAFEDFRKHAGQYEDHGAIDERLRGSRWEAVKEIWGAFDAFSNGEEKYSAAFGKDIIQSIPPGSIYFGGTDSGRFIVTAMCRSQVEGDPFFTLTQNALADATYLDYLRSIYGNKIYVPTAEDSARCLEEYRADFERRAALGQLQPGEGVKTQDSRMAISGQVSVMKINGLLCKVIIDKNPDREFYIEESFPLDWMYPYLEPHGLIFKINRQPLLGLSDEIVQRDRDYWTNCVQPMIGDWLKPDATVADVASFAEKVFLQHDFSGFSGDSRFVQNAYTHNMFSKERASIAGLYAWRGQQATDAVEKKRMNTAADFAFRQAWALCPYSPEAVFRYVNLLLSQNRVPDALLVAETAARMPAMQGSDGSQVRALVEQLKKFQKAK
jgi:hypothetical protein